MWLGGWFGLRKWAEHEGCFAWDSNSVENGFYGKVLGRMLMGRVHELQAHGRIWNRRMSRTGKDQKNRVEGIGTK